MGFDDAGYGAYAMPPLSSVRIDAEEFGLRAARDALGQDHTGVPRPGAAVIERASV
ncbi:hypothetical protein [Glycomyces dulcitolivorans]|uniref:hypothetical protein n=1 Tax=Glycomyces dulcitolivorans TaxID=2200759 RepID=UPI0038CC19B3